MKIKLTYLFLIYLVISIVVFSFFLGKDGTEWYKLLYAVLLSVLPIPLLGWLIWRQDRVKEPLDYLMGCFTFSASVSLVVALIANTQVYNIFGDNISSLIVAPLIEELFKAIPIFAIVMLWPHEYETFVDAVLYATASALGFAMMENILYYAQNDLSPQLVITRGITTAYAHPLFTSLSAIGLLLYLKRKQIYWVLGGYILAVILHSIWNTGAILGLAYFYLIYFMAYIPLITIIFIAIRKESKLK